MQIKWKRFFITVISVVLFVGSSFVVTHYGKEPPPPFDLELMLRHRRVMNHNLKVRADVALRNLNVHKKLWDQNMGLIKRLEQSNQRPDLQQTILEDMYDLYHESKVAIIKDGMRNYPYSTHWYPTMVNYYKNEVPRPI